MSRPSAGSARFHGSSRSSVQLAKSVAYPCTGEIMGVGGEEGRRLLHPKKVRPAKGLPQPCETFASQSGVLEEVATHERYVWASSTEVLGILHIAA